MPINQTNKLAWIVKTIYKARRISFAELNRRWMRNEDLSGGEEMVKRTFHKWRNQILDTFGLVVECEKTPPYRYYIENEREMKSGSIEGWLLDTYSASNSLIGCKSIRDRIFLEEIPSGSVYLDSVMEAMKMNRFIHVAYYNYRRGDVREHYMMPLCIKLFRRRWYLVGRPWPSGEDRLYCLDRVRDFRLSSHVFDYPEDFNPKVFFDGCFGIIADKNCKVENVKLRVSARQANYMRDLPMHASQEEVERNESYSIFSMKVRASYDFQQELLWNREELEVLEPLWLREEMVETIKRMLGKYQA